MTRERAKELEKNGVLPAWREGWKIQVSSGKPDPFEDYKGTSPDFGNTYWQWRVAPEPKIRPWGPSEVPVGAQVRFAGNEQSLRMLIVSNMESHILGDQARWTYAELCKQMEHSTDGGKTWKPCGVMEGGETQGFGPQPPGSR